MTSRYRSTGVGVYRASERHFAVYPRKYRWDNSRYGVVFSHPVAQDATVTTGNNGGHPVIDALCDAGYPVLVTDLAGTSHWGNDAAFGAQGAGANQPSAMTDTVSFLFANMKVKPSQFFVYGVSMGTLVLNWIKNNLSQVKGAAFTIPAVDPVDIHDNNRGGYAVAIETAHGGAAAWTAAAPTHSPLQAGPQFLSMPMQLFVSDDDPICVPSQAQAFAAASGARYTSLGAVGHTPSVNPAFVVGFFDSLGGRK